MFNLITVENDCVKWLYNFFEKNGRAVMQLWEFPAERAARQQQLFHLGIKRYIANIKSEVDGLICSVG